MQKMISNIVFTKNRPLQLEGYLESLYKHYPLELIQTYILYKPELFDEEYQHLFHKFKNCIVIKENDFHRDFLKLLGGIDTKFLLFGVDDVVYFDSIDFEVVNETFDKFSDDIFGFSLRFNRENTKKSDPVSETVAAGQTVYFIDWTRGKTPSTQYPFELCATIYSTALVKRLINSVMNDNPVIKRLFSLKFLGKIASKHKILKSFGYFYNPNTLESWSCRWCQNHSDNLPGFLFFQRQCATAIQVNMVNISARKGFDGSDEYTIETLAEKFKQGYRLNIDFVSQNRPAGTHGGSEYFRLVRIKSE